MALLADTHPTLLDLTKRTDPNGEIDAVAEILKQHTPVFEDAVVLEANQTFGHRTTIRTGLGAAAFRKLNEGVAPTKSTTAQVTDTIGTILRYSEVDAMLVEPNANTARWIASEDMPAMAAIAQTAEATYFNGNEGSTPEAFNGFKVRYNNKTLANGENILLGSGTSTEPCSSIYLVGWGPQTCHLIYPKATQAGIVREFEGNVTSENFGGTGLRAPIYRTRYQLSTGLSVRDWRYAVRIGRIHTSDLNANASGNSDNLINLMVQAVDLLPETSTVRPVFYCSRTVMTFLRLQIENRIANSTLTYEMVGGKREVMFQGIPVRRCDALAVAEAANELITA